VPVLADRTHTPWLCRCHRGWPAVHRLLLGTGEHGVPQQRATLGEFLLAHAIRQEAEMPYPLEAAWGDVQHQASQEFHGLERQGTQTVAALVIRSCT
jgi:hypothetical protein